MPKKPRIHRTAKKAKKPNGGWHTTTTSRHERGYDSEWMKLRRRVLASYPTCYIDGCKRKSTHVDHVIPKADGGTNDLRNLRGICAICHGKKSSKEGHDRRGSSRSETTRRGKRRPPSA